MGEEAAESAGDGLGGVVGGEDLDGDFSAGGVGQWEFGGDERVFESDCAGADERNFAPDADVAATDGGYPVPANGGVVGGVVRAGRAAVFAGGLVGLLLAAAGRGVLEDADGEGVGAAGVEFGGDVEVAAHEAAVDIAEALAVEVDLG